MIKVVYKITVKIAPPQKEVTNWHKSSENIFKSFVGIKEA
jgi:hypothetical protein